MLYVQLYEHILKISQLMYWENIDNKCIEKKRKTWTHNYQGRSQQVD